MAGQRAVLAGGWCGRRLCQGRAAADATVGCAPASGETRPGQDGGRAGAGACLCGGEANLQWAQWIGGAVAALTRIARREGTSCCHSLFGAISPPLGETTRGTQAPWNIHTFCRGIPGFARLAWFTVGPFWVVSLVVEGREETPRGPTTHVQKGLPLSRPAHALLAPVTFHSRC
jgi:hypothetical protein